MCQLTTNRFRFECCVDYNVCKHIPETRKQVSVNGVCTSQCKSLHIFFILLPMNIFNRNLKSVEEACLRALHLSSKVTGEVLVDNTIGGSKKGKDVGDEMTFVVG